MFKLSDALTSLAGRKEFAVVRQDGLVSINYLIRLPDSFDGIRENFRGVTFDEETGCIVSLPFHKFCNVNETEQTQWPKLASLSATISEKVDGSLIHFMIHKRALLSATRMSVGTAQAQAAYRLLTDETTALIHDNIRRGFTPLFEYVAPENQIVVEYPGPRLVYLNSRCRESGEYFFDERFQDKVQRFTFSFADLLKQLEDRRDFEGYVCQLENGLWVKAKCNWYLERHRAIDALMKPAYKLYELVFLGVMDDLIALAPDRYKPALCRIYAEAQSDLLAESERLNHVAGACSAATQRAELDTKENRKRYALHARDRYAPYFSALMLRFDNRDATAVLQEKLMDDYREKYKRRVIEDLAD